MVSLINFVVLLTVAGVLSSVVPAVSVAALALMLVLTAVFFLNRQSIDRMGVLIALNFIFWLLTGFVSGGLQFGDFTNTTFFAGEGRIFLAYIPALFFAVSATSPRNAEFLIRLLLAVAALLALSAIAYQLGLVPASLTSGRGHLRLLFSSHHAAGGTGAMLLIVGVVTYIERPAYRRWLALILIGLLIFMASVNSRTAVVAAMAVLAWAALTSMRRMSKTQIRYMMGGLILTALLPSVIAAADQPFADRLGQIFSTSIWHDAVEQIQMSEREGDLNLLDKVLAAREGGNILARVRLWSFAVNRFVRSPLIGIGFGRWNDDGVHYTGIEGVMMLATHAVWRSDSVSSAHNSYFHLLAEGEIVGLGLLLGFWISLYRRTKVVAQLAEPGSAQRIIATSARMTVIFVLAASVTNHAMAAPAYTLLALTLAGVCLRQQKSAPVRASAIPGALVEQH